MKCPVCDVAHKLKEHVETCFQKARKPVLETLKEHPSPDWYDTPLRSRHAKQQIAKLPLELRRQWRKAQRYREWFYKRPERLQEIHTGIQRANAIHRKRLVRLQEKHGKPTFYPLVESKIAPGLVAPVEYPIPERETFLTSRPNDEPVITKMSLWQFSECSSHEGTSLRFTPTLSCRLVDGEKVFTFLVSQAEWEQMSCGDLFLHHAVLRKKGWCLVNRFQWVLLQDGVVNWENFKMVIRDYGQRYWNEYHRIVELENVPDRQWVKAPKREPSVMLLEPN